MEVVGEKFNQIHHSGARRQSQLGSSNKYRTSSYLQNRSGPPVVPANNSSRMTTGQAQALQKLKDVKVAKITVAPKSPTESKPNRKVPNYVKLMQEEGFSSSTA